MFELQRIKFDLQDFWAVYDKLIRFEDRLFMLQNYATRKYNFSNFRKRYKRVRQRKFKLLYRECNVCLNKRSTYIHHIIQLQHGGDNRGKNRIRLCHYCHILIHPHMQTDLPCAVADGQQGIEG